ncbi:MAG: hypothetical protein AAGF57_19710 [Pseudomonadota bacterium]
MIVIRRWVWGVMLGVAFYAIHLLSPMHTLAQNNDTPWRVVINNQTNQAINADRSYYQVLYPDKNVEFASEPPVSVPANSSVTVGRLLSFTGDLVKFSTSFSLKIPDANFNIVSSAGLPFGLVSYCQDGGAFAFTYSSQVTTSTEPNPDIVQLVGYLLQDNNNVDYMEVVVCELSGDCSPSQPDAIPAVITEPEDFGC